MEHLEYRYRPKPWIMLLVVLFFGICAFALSDAALNNDEGLILNGIIQFNPDGATIFYWCLAGASAVFVALGISMFFVGLFSKRVLTISSTELSLPKYGWSSKYTIVPLKDIKSISIQTVNRQRILNINHSKGKLSIAQSMLPSSEAFESIHKFIAVRDIGD